MRLFIFDVDGTLTQTNELDADCYLRAVERHLDLDAFESDWREFEHPTAAGITRELLETVAGSDVSDAAVETIRSAFVEELEGAIDDGEDIQPIPGATEVFAELRDRPGITAAIATGDWRVSSHLKLAEAGLAVEDVPFACSDDAVARHEIIRSAVGRTEAGSITAFDTVTYVGDGVWDVRAARRLGIDFVGIGRGNRAERLRSARADTVLPDYREFIAAVDLGDWS